MIVKALLPASMPPGEASMHTLPRGGAEAGRVVAFPYLTSFRVYDQRHQNAGFFHCDAGAISILETFKEINRIALSPRVASPLPHSMGSSKPSQGGSSPPTGHSPADHIQWNTRLD